MARPRANFREGERCAGYCGIRAENNLTRRAALTAANKKAAAARLIRAKLERRGPESATDYAHPTQGDWGVETHTLAIAHLGESAGASGAQQRLQGGAFADGHRPLGAPGCLGLIALGDSSAGDGGPKHWAAVRAKAAAGAWRVAWNRARAPLRTAMPMQY